MRERLAELVKEMQDGGMELKIAVREFEILYIEEALERAGGNISRAAENLGVHRNTLRSKIQAARDRGKGGASKGKRSSRRRKRRT